MIMLNEVGKSVNWQLSVQSKKYESSCKCKALVFDEIKTVVVIENR